MRNNFYVLYNGAFVFFFTIGLFWHGYTKIEMYNWEAVLLSLHILAFFVVEYRAYKKDITPPQPVPMPQFTKIKRKVNWKEDGF